MPCHMVKVRMRDEPCLDRASDIDSNPWLTQKTTTVVVNKIIAGQLSAAWTTEILYLVSEGSPSFRQMIDCLLQLRIIELTLRAIVALGSDDVDVSLKHNEISDLGWS